MLMMPSFCRDTVEIVRPKIVVERGTTIKDYDNPEKTITVNNCSVQPVSSSTNWTDPRQAQTVRAVLYLKPNTDIQADDMVIYDGQNYAIDGVPHTWKSPSGRIDHIQCQLIDWRG